MMMTLMKLSIMNHDDCDNEDLLPCSATHKGDKYDTGDNANHDTDDICYMILMTFV